MATSHPVHQGRTGYGVGLCGSDKRKMKTANLKGTDTATEKQTPKPTSPPAAPGPAQPLEGSWEGRKQRPR